MRQSLRKTAVFIALSALIGSFGFYNFSLADTAADLNAKIADRTAAIAALEKDIADYQNQLQQIGAQKSSLQNEIKALDLTSKNLAANISVTENKIDKANLQLDQLGSQIDQKSNELDDSRQALASALRDMNENDSISLVTAILSAGSISESWDALETSERFEAGVKDQISMLNEVKTDLEGKRDATSKIKAQLTSLKRELAGEKQAADYSSSQKASLLKATKNNEANYQNLLAQKTALRDSFEQELTNFEAQLKLLNDPSSIPKAAPGMLSWPVHGDIVITQYFGNTPFANAHQALYNGKGHNGIDLRASIGTPIYSAADGTVLGTGNTDAVCPGASFGKWVLVEHNNGLTTLYAHFSVFSVKTGDQVSANDLLGYSGNTGATTGPHLHFTVYASQGVKIMSYKSKVCKGTYTMPVADLKAYLNPLSYLPALAE